MIQVRKDLVVPRGTYRRWKYTFMGRATPTSTPTPSDYSGYTFKCWAKAKHNDAEKFEFAVDGSGLSAGVLYVALVEEVSIEMGGSYVWDMAFLDGDNHIGRPFYGDLFVPLHVTDLMPA